MGNGSIPSRSGSGCLVYLLKNWDFDIFFFCSLSISFELFFISSFRSIFTHSFCISFSPFHLSININLNVSRTCAQWLTALLSSHASTILKHAAYSAKLKLLICTCFCAHYEWSLSKTSETISQWPKTCSCSQLNRQKQQSSVAKGIRTMTLNRWAWVEAQVGEKMDA